MVAASGTGAMTFAGSGPAGVVVSAKAVLPSIIPLYVYPASGGAGTGWATANAWPPFAVIANPGTGPGTSVDSNYTTAITNARAKGIKVLGYVNTNYGARPLGTTGDTASSNTVYGDINGWTTLYGTIDGYFFDITPTDAGAHLTYTQNAASYARSHLAGAFVMCNPGTYPLVSGYIDLADTTCVFEGTYSSYTSFSVPSYTNGYQLHYAATRMCHLVYACASEANSQAVKSNAINNNVGYYLASNDPSGAWSTFVSYWPAEYVDLHSGNLDWGATLSPTGAAASGSGAMTFAGSGTAVVSAVAGSGAMTFDGSGTATVGTFAPTAWVVFGTVSSRWTLPGDKPAYSHWMIGAPLVSMFASASLEYVRVPVQVTMAGVPYNPTADTVQFAFTTTMREPLSTDWVIGTWETTGVGSFYAMCLIGPSGVIQLTTGTYYVWVKVTDSPEVPVKQAGSIQIYP